MFLCYSSSNDEYRHQGIQCKDPKQKKPVAKLQDLLLQARILRLAEKGIFMIHMFYRYGPWETRNYESSDILQEI